MIRRPRDVANKIKSIVKIATMKICDDSGPFRFCRIKSFGKEQKVNAFTPYGLINNPPKDSMAVVFLVGGEESKSIALIDDPKRRIKNMEEGEVGLANYLTGSTIIIKSNGDVDVDAHGNVNVTATGNINATTTQDITLSAGQEIYLNTPSIRWNGGTIDNSGVTVQSGDITADTVSLKTHVHSGVQSGPDNTGTPVT
jgi:phage baseplate assembly protein V